MRVSIFHSAFSSHSYTSPTITSHLGHLFRIFVVLQVLFGSISAIPAGTSSSTPPNNPPGDSIEGSTSAARPKTPAVPTVEELRVMIRKAGKIGKNTVFWTGGADMFHATAYAAELNPPGGTYNTALTAVDHETYDTRFKDKPAQKKLFNHRLSEAISWEAKGTAFVIIPDNVGVTEVEKDSKGKPMEKSAWVENEFPTLQRNPDINLVIRVSDAEYPYKKRSPPVWKKGSTPTLPASNA